MQVILVYVLSRYGLLSLVPLFPIHVPSDFTMVAPTRIPLHKKMLKINLFGTYIATMFRTAKSLFDNLA